MGGGKTDKVLIFLVLTLFAVGLVALYSAGGEHYFMAQLKRGAVAVLLMFAVSRVPMGVLEHAVTGLFFAVLLMLIGVLLFGVEINNARRWLYFGFYVQPSEIMKVLLPVGLAYGYARLSNIKWWHNLVAVAVVFVPVLLVFQQPDFGTSALIALSGFATIFFAGIGWWWLFGFFVTALALLPLGWLFLLKPYQQERVLTMLDPYQDPLGAGYHTIQSQIAIGSGGTWGKGFQSGTQAQLGFLPERHTDFIFSVFAEEFGFVGAIVLLSLAVLIAWRCLHIASCSKTMFGYCAATGITTVFFMTFVINLSMASGLLPVVGMPLPLVSYGGTALFSSFFGFGLILAIYRQTQSRSNGY